MTIQKGKSLIKWQNQKLKHRKQIDNNCHIPTLVHAFSYVENNRRLNLVLKLAKSLTCMTVASNPIILTTMSKQNKDIIGRHVKNRRTSVSIAL